MLNHLINNSHVIRYKNNYIALEDVYDDYINQINNTGYEPYNHITLNEFIVKGNYY